MTVAVVFHGGCYCGNDEYLFVSKKDQEFFIEINPEQDDENSGLDRAVVFEITVPGDGGKVLFVFDYDCFTILPILNCVVFYSFLCECRFLPETDRPGIRR